MVIIIIIFLMKSLQLLSVFRPNQLSGKMIAMRGPKKKKGGVADAGPISQDIINIWKDRGDPKIVSTDLYPPYIQDLLGVKYAADDVMW